MTEKKAMNWYLLVLLSAPGLIMGLLSLRGHTQKIEFFLWLALGVFAALVLARNADTRWFLCAMLVGLAWGILNSLVQCVFFETYSTNNAEMLKGFQERPSPIPVRFFFLVLGPVIGAATGLVMAGMTFVLQKLIRPGG